jgi:hypothetical protein
MLSNLYLMLTLGTTLEWVIRVRRPYGKLWDSQREALLHVNSHTCGAAVTKCGAEYTYLQDSGGTSTLQMPADQEILRMFVITAHLKGDSVQYFASSAASGASLRRLFEHEETRQ